MLRSFWRCCDRRVCMGIPTYYFLAALTMREVDSSSMASTASCMRFVPTIDKHETVHYRCCQIGVYWGDEHYDLRHRGLFRW